MMRMLVRVARHGGWVYRWCERSKNTSEYCLFTVYMFWFLHIIRKMGSKLIAQNCLIFINPKFCAMRIRINIWQFSIRYILHEKSDAETGMAGKHRFVYLKTPVRSLNAVVCATGRPSWSGLWMRLQKFRVRLLHHGWPDRRQLLFRFTLRTLVSVQTGPGNWRSLL